MNIHPKLLRKSLEAHTTAVALPEGRMVGSPGHAQARGYLLRQMKRLRLEFFHGDSYELPYKGTRAKSGKPITFTNLAGVIPGKNRNLPPILVGAHYDSVIAAPCADDNATSVAFTLALAECYYLSPLERDLIIVFFDAEEPPYFLSQNMGSVRFHKQFCRDRRFAAVIVTDLIGHDADLSDLRIKIPEPYKTMARAAVSNLPKLVAVMGAESDGTFPAIVEAAAGKTSGIRVLTTLSDYIGPVSDHGAFAQAGQPFLFLSCGQGRHYHSPEDDLRWINFDKLTQITRFAADIIERIDRTPADADHAPADPFETEMRMFRRFFGLALPLILKMLGIKMPKCREELTRMIDERIYGRKPKV